MRSQVRLTDSQLRLYAVLIQHLAPEELEAFVAGVNAHNRTAPRTSLFVVDRNDAGMPVSLSAPKPEPRQILQNRVKTIAVFSRTLILPLFLVCILPLTCSGSLISNWSHPSYWGRITTDLYRGQTFSIDRAEALRQIGFYLGDVRQPVAELGIYSFEQQTFLTSVVFPIGSHFDMEPYAVDFNELLDTGSYAFFLKGDCRIGYLDSNLSGSALYYAGRQVPIDLRPQDLAFYVMLEPSTLAEPNSLRLFLLNSGWLLVVLGTKGRGICA